MPQEIQARHEDALPAPVAVSEGAAIISMIERASRDPNVDIDKMERLLEMQERVIARAAKAAYSAAFAQMQTELPSIPERGRGHGNITYALWEDVNDAIKPALARHGFGISFRVGRQAAQLTVTGILAHRDGHSEETTIELPADQSGSKNAVQAIGSSTSYGKRYVAAALLNLTSRAVEDKDDDGAAAARPATISDEQVQQLQDLIIEAGADPVRFLAVGKIEKLSDMKAADFDGAVKILRAKAARARP